MRAYHFAVLATVSLLTANSAVAQTTGPQGADSNQHSTPATDGSGASKPAPNPGPQGAPAGVTITDSTDKQPQVVTGEDLKGPPKAFPSNKAPE